MKVEFVTNDPLPDMHQAAGERMWIELTSISRDGYEGTLRNVPVVIRDLKQGQLIRCEARNILDMNLYAEDKHFLLDSHGLFEDDESSECAQLN